MNHSISKTASGTEIRTETGTENPPGATGDRGLIDARALWWHEADDCRHDSEWEECECWSEPGWDFGRVPSAWTVELSGHRYVTDCHLLIREDLLANWPGPWGPDNPGGPSLHPPTARTAEALAAMLALSEAAGPVDREFRLQLAGPLLAAGYELRGLQHARGVHAVVDQAGTRVGLLMPLPVAAAGVSRSEGSRS